MPVDLESARTTLRELFADVENRILEHTAPPLNAELIPAIDSLFTTSVQSYREALLGIALVRFQDRRIDLRLPYVNQGPRAYNGRELDEQVVNPFLQKHRVPCSRGPYLAMLRRDFRFEPSKRDGLRDKAGYDALLLLISMLERMDSDEGLRGFIEYLLYKFAELREAAEVPLSRLRHISLEQFDIPITSLLDTASAGRIPVFLIVAALRAIKDFFGVDWVIDHQGINVADSQTGAGGDITISRNGRIIFAAEITERPVERTRVIATFNTKIAPHGIEDYLFFIRAGTLAEDARRQGQQYFAQGHEVNFIEIKEWLLMSLATMGRHGRDLFQHHLVELLSDLAVPRSVKVSWNNYISALTDSSGHGHEF